MPTVLCIDDHETGLSTRRLLLETKGYLVLTAANGHAGLDLLARHPDITVVILDYSMPVFNGEQVAQAIRQQWPAVGIIMLSGYPELPQSSLHVSDVLIREGASPLELLAALERLTGERPTPKVPAEVERSRELIKKIGESFPRMPARKGKIE